MWVAITPQNITKELIKHYVQIEPVIDHLILRTDSTTQKQTITALLEHGFPKSKLTVHTHTALLQQFDLTHIHFKENDDSAFELKRKHPNVCVSMSTHSKQSAQTAQAHHLDYVLFGHLFETPSKLGVPPRSPKEIESVLTVDLPVVALGGINSETLAQIPCGFSGIAAISLFTHHDLHTLRLLKEGE